MALVVQLTCVWPMIRRMRAAASRSDEIVWIYGHTTPGNRRGTHDHVTLGLEDGARVELQTTHLNDDDRQALLDELQARSPRATHGYGPAQAQAFRGDPRSLRRRSGAPFGVRDRVPTELERLVMRALDSDPGMTPAARAGATPAVLRPTAACCSSDAIAGTVALSPGALVQPSRGRSGEHVAMVGAQVMRRSPHP